MIKLRINIGDSIDWKGRTTNKRFSCIVKEIKRRKRICKIVPDYERPNSMPYQYFWIDFDEILLPL